MSTMKDPGTIALRWSVVKGSLNENQRRLWLGSEAQALGANGVSTVARAAGVSRATVTRGLELIEGLHEGEEEPGALKPAVRQRRQGGGRKSLTASQPGMLKALLQLVEPEAIRGRAPPLLWTSKSREKLAEELCEAGYRVGGPALGELLKAQRFRVRCSSKFTGHTPRPVPKEQFQFINDRLVQAWQLGWPVLGVELFGVARHSVPRDDEPDFTYARYRRLDDRFANDAPACDESAECEVCGASKFNRGLLIDPDITTVKLVAQALEHWWGAVGEVAADGAARLTVVVGGLSSEEALMRQLSKELVGFARLHALPLEVLHLPAGTSRWRRVLRRFSLATNCYDVGRRLERHEVILEQPITGSRRTGRDRYSTAGNMQVRGLGTSAGVTVEIEPLNEYRAWNYCIRVE